MRKEIDRLIEKFEPVPFSGCWIWTAGLNKAGYGKIRIGEKMQLAHRVAYQFLHKEIPHGLDLDHLCRVRCCVNPAHLEPVTRGVNTLRGKTIAAENAAKTVCKHGHPFDEKNTYVASDGERGCRKCNLMARRRYLERTQP